MGQSGQKVLGAAIFIESFTLEGPPVPHMNLRPVVLISVACVVYGYIMKPAGLVIATAALVYISAFGGHDRQAIGPREPLDDLDRRRFVDDIAGTPDREGVRIHVLGVMPFACL